jgi:hypothetical protein
MGNSPPSLESSPGDGSITIGVPKKSMHCGPADCILIGCLQGEWTWRLNSLNSHGAPKMPNPAQGSGRGGSVESGEPFGVADE